MESDVETPSARLRYRIDGPADAPPVLLVNSLGTTMDLWAAQVEPLARRYKVIRYDVRGHGRSSVPPGEYTLDDLGHDAVHVLDAAGVGDAYVCGVSLGALTAMWLGVYRPSRVRGLVIANTAARVGTPERWTDRIAKVRADGMGAIADLALGNWFTPAFRQREPAVAKRFHEMVASCSPDGYIGCCAALRDADLRPAIPGIRTRSLVIAGDQDPSMAVAEAEFIRDAIPGSSLLTLHGAHLTNVECAEIFTMKIEVAFSAASAQTPAATGRPAGEKMRRRILGDEHVDRALQNVTPLTRDFQNFITRYVWAEIWTRPGLDERTRRVLVIGTMLALGRWEEFAMHVRAAVREGGFTVDDIKEVILQQAVYCGVPAAHHALKVAGEALELEGNVLR
jgi:3-oxoadipate enol-lactonase/4-carboxymuconolactone decarboxylase